MQFTSRLITSLLVFCLLTIAIIHLAFFSVHGNSSPSSPSISSSPANSKQDVSKDVVDPPAQIISHADDKKWVTLNNGVAMPRIGFGTAGLGPAATRQATRQASEVGFRHFDCAQAREWYSEDVVGKVLRSAPNVPDRSELFLTTKIHPRHFGRTQTLDVFSNSLFDLGTTYLDLVLLHYPQCWGSLCLNQKPEGTWRDAWKALEELQESGRARAIGVSNFGQAEMTALIGEARRKPQVLQIHIDPLSQNRQLTQYCKQHGVQVEAYSALGTQHPRVGPDQRNPVLTHPVLKGIAQELNRSVAEVVLRWLQHIDIVALPRSTNPAHMREALHGVWEFELEQRHLDAILKLDGSRPV